MSHYLKTNLKNQGNNIHKFFKAAWLIAVPMIISASAKADSGWNDLYVVTPSWENRTNEDSTGLYFEIVRAVYEPAGIKLKI